MDKRSLNIFLTLILALLFVFSSSLFLCAQETKSDEFTLEEITVTAQKRAEDSQKVPLAMDIITGDQIAESGKTNVDDILSSISTIMINRAADGMRVAVRGLVENETPNHDMHTSSPMVAMNIDGAYNGASSAGENLFDVERVEVLYGPQSTLYASNSPGGIVNVVTASPKTDKYTANASIELGNYKLINVNFAGNAPLVKDKLAMRLATQYYTVGSYTSDETADRTKSARLKTLYQPNDKLSATVTVNYSQRVNGGMLMGNVKPFDYQDGYWYTSSGGGPGTPTVWTKDSKVTNPWTEQTTTAGAGGGNMPGGGGDGAPGLPDSSVKVLSGPNQGKQYTKGITGEISWDTGIGSLSVVPQYSRTTSDDQSHTTDSGYTYLVKTAMRSYQKGVELRMTSPADFFFKWILGLNYYKSENARYTNTSSDDPTALAYSFMVMGEKDRAVFANVTYPITDKLRGTGGYRLSWTEGSNGGTDPDTGKATTPNISSLPRHPDYRLGVEYDLASNSMVYGTYATSYRANPMALGTGGALTEDTTEKLKSYTVGTKNRFFGNKLQVNVAAYYYDYRNKSANINTDGRIGAGTSAYVTNLYDTTTNKYVDLTGVNSSGYYSGGLTDPRPAGLAKFRTIGVDFDTQWVITSKDRLNFSVSYLNATWQDLVMNFGYKYRDPSTGTLTKFWATDGMDYSGYTNTFSPKWTITSSYEHNFELGSYGLLTPHIDVNYKSSYFLDYQNQTITYQEAYYLLNGSVTFNPSSSGWSLNVYVKNATDYCVKNFFVNMGTASLGVGNPRTYGAVFSVKF
jgi:iron complex outermembrane recepter protein